MNPDVLEDLGRLSRRPLAFVRWAFPWGEAGSLEKETGPDEWQTQILGLIEAGLISPDQAIQIAIASGHGVGKSALVAWIILWAISTFPDTRGVVTANTENQLKTKTWAELGKWVKLFIAREMFTLTATSLYSVDPAHERTWRVDMIPWSERNAEAFAGMHNQGKRVLMIFDEASAIPNIIWETSEGVLTDTETQIIWLVCGNPTLNTGRFRECFAGGQFHHRWKTYQVDSRTARHTNKQQISEWVADYGEDSDFVRVRVRGVFPRAGTLQFISGDLVDEAKTREAVASVYDPFVMGVDVARYGDDRSVIRFRRGRDARTIAPIKLRGVDTMTLAARIVDEAQKLKVDAIFVDGGGVGGGVVDRLRMLRQPVFDVQFGGRSDRGTIGIDDNLAYANKRAEMWGALREWLKGGSIDADPELVADLIGVQYGYTVKDGRDAIILEKKEDMKRRGLASPDDADALALTFAYPVVPSDHTRALASKPAHKFEYEPFDEAQNVVKLRRRA